MKPRLILICGLPGAGKTTTSKQLAAKMLAIRLCPDDWLRDLSINLFDETSRDRIENRLWRHSQELLKLGQSVILESGFWSRSERDEKRLWARAHDIAVELRFLDVPIPELLRRVQTRYSENNNAEIPITRAHLEEWSRIFQAPGKDELFLFDPPQVVARSR